MTHPFTQNPHAHRFALTTLNPVERIWNVIALAHIGPEFVCKSVKEKKMKMLKNPETTRRRGKG